MDCPKIYIFGGISTYIYIVIVCVGLLILCMQVKKRSSDARRALDVLGLLNEGAPVGNLLGVDLDFGQFKGRLDLNMAGMMGHSFGGATVIQTLSEDQRFK